MKCPYCGEDDDKVVDSRSMSAGAIVRRRRECNHCEKRFTTYERVEDLPLMVVKRDTTREPFDRAKVAKSIRIACRKRPVTEEQIEEITSSIEHRLVHRNEREVQSADIGEDVLKELTNLDQVAYVRFASVYRDFKDLNGFYQELSHLMQEKHVPKIADSNANLSRGVSRRTRKK
ncbi:MAG: transcriptional repressor NrdR [Candidatus Omnitrophota bacterium]|jgi:transcriptional repressor NrdR|nr:MAG: transcriptional repressor NrdR [Candidatus Omnitrophota bacterium]